MSPLFVGRPAPAQPSLPVCLQCGVQSTGSGATFCRRCGLPYGEAPRAYMAPTCPICYRDAADDGRFESLLMAMSQVAPFGPDVVLVGDQLEWAEARAALARLMERYHRVPPARGLR